MKAFRHIVLAIVFILTASTGVAHDRVLRVKDGKILTIQEMADEIKKSAFVFIGETHDSAEDHQSQLAVIQALAKAGKKLAIGLEMFRAESQQDLDAWVRGTSTPEQFIPVYYKNWGLPWPLYSDILLFAREQKIPLIGLNIPEGIVRAVARSGFASLNEEQKKKLPPNITCTVDTEYMNFIRRAHGGHHPREDRSFLHFCEAQMVWDTAMAFHVAEYARKNPERSVVVLAGTVHAWKRAMPEQLSGFSKGAFTVILPETGGNINKPRVTTRDADYLLLRDSVRNL